MHDMEFTSAVSCSLSGPFIVFQLVPGAPSIASFTSVGSFKMQACAYSPVAGKSCR